MMWKLAFEDGLISVKPESIVSNTPLLILSGYRSRLIQSLMKCDEIRLVFHDIYGVYRDYISYSVIPGVDIKVDIFDDPVISQYVLRAVLREAGLNVDRWMLIYNSFLRDLRTEEDRSIDLLFTKLYEAVDRESGLVKMAYTELLQIMSILFDDVGRDVIELYEEPIEFADGNILLDYSLYNPILGKLLAPIFTRKLSNACGECIQVLLAADYLRFTPPDVLENIILNGHTILQMAHKPSTVSIYKLILVDTKLLINTYRLDVVYPYDYVVLDGKITQFLYIEDDQPHGKIGIIGRGGDSFEENIEPIDDQLANAILRVVDKFGVISIDGIVLNLHSYSRYEVLHGVKYLLREGCLTYYRRREPKLLRITTKGRKLLGGDVDA